MDDSSKNLFDAALKMASAANEQWKKNISELMSKGNLSAEEGKGLLENLENKMLEGQKEYEKLLKKTYSNISSSFSEKPKAPTINSLLERRIVSLELKVSLMAREMMAQKKLITQLLQIHQSDETVSDEI
jgi:polyhydroxyalkanoate synthesis regulator phasin